MTRRDRGVVPVEGDIVWCPAMGCGRNLGPMLPGRRVLCRGCGALVGYDGRIARLVLAGEVDPSTARVTNRLRRQLAARKAATS